MEEEGLLAAGGRPRLSPLHHLHQWSFSTFSGSLSDQAAQWPQALLVSILYWLNFLQNCHLKFIFCSQQSPRRLPGDRLEVLETADVRESWRKSHCSKSNFMAIPFSLLYRHWLFTGRFDPFLWQDTFRVIPHRILKCLLSAAFETRISICWRQIEENSRRGSGD